MFANNLVHLDTGACVAASPALASLVGASAVMEQLRSTIRRLARSDRPVLVLGPTGSGKESVVRAIHELGAPAGQPLIDVNCGAIPGTLIEAQLFGHQRGSFTGAESDQVGYIGAAQRGTLFLDEIAELPIDLQARLLRVLETYRYRPVGAIDERVFSGRVIAATHADLEQRVADNEFREDLYFRLNVLVVRVPSLSERREDIPALIDCFLSEQRRPPRLAPCAVEVLMAREWPGNVRQLRNVIDRVAVFADHDVVTADELSRIIGLESPRRMEREPAEDLDSIARAILDLPVANKLEAIEQHLIALALELSGSNKSKAARLLGVHRKKIERRASDVG